jgi:hypothetical protein
MQKPWVGGWETKNNWLAMARQVRVLAALPVHRLTNDPPVLLIQKFVRRIVGACRALLHPVS